MILQMDIFKYYFDVL